MEKIDKLNWKIGTGKNNKNQKLIKKQKKKDSEGFNIEERKNMCVKI